MRLPYTSADPQGLSTEDEAVVNRIQARRGPAGLLAIDRTLLHSPPVADGWNTLIGAVRSKLELSDDIRELAICRVALLNNVALEWDAHLPLLKKALQLQDHADEKMAKVQERDPTVQGRLSDMQWAVLRYADEMTRNVKVSKSTFENLKQTGLSDRQIVELTTVVGAYNMVSRVVIALNVGEKNND